MSARTFDFREEDKAWILRSSPQILRFNNRSLNWVTESSLSSVISYDFNAPTKLEDAVPSGSGFRTVCRSPAAPHIECTVCATGRIAKVGALVTSIPTTCVSCGVVGGSWSVSANWRATTGLRQMEGIRDLPLSFDDVAVSGTIVLSCDSSTVVASS